MGMTQQRRKILEIVMESTDHPTAEQVFDKARTAMPNIGLGTVYRNLNYLADQGEIRRLAIPDEPVRFDPTTQAHSHLRCIKCGKIIDVMVEHYELPKDFYKEGMQILDYSLMANCICKDCAEQAK